MLKPRYIKWMLSLFCTFLLLFGTECLFAQEDSETESNAATKTEMKASAKANADADSDSKSTSNATVESDPIAMLKGVTGRVMNALKTNRSDYQSNPNRLYTLVNDLIIPYADFAEMSRWVVGRNAWNAASDSTKKAFSDALKNLVIRTYARSLLNYTDQTIEFMPLRQPVEGKARTIVSSIIRDGGKGNLRLDYRLVREGNSWKVYDIVIEGISLMQGYRAQFEDEVQQGGVEAALQKIRQQKGNQAS